MNGKWLAPTRASSVGVTIVRLFENGRRRVGMRVRCAEAFECEGKEDSEAVRVGKLTSGAQKFLAPLQQFPAVAGRRSDFCQLVEDADGHFVVFWRASHHSCEVIRVPAVLLLEQCNEKGQHSIWEVKVFLPLANLDHVLFERLHRRRQALHVNVRPWVGVEKVGKAKSELCSDH